MSEHRIGIIGLGPVGTILGAHLAQSGVDVFGVELSKERATQVGADGFVVEGFTEIRGMAEKCFTSIAELGQVDGLDGVFLCTKTWAINSVMNEFVKITWPEEMRIVAFMNGIGPEDAVSRYVPKERILRGVVNYAGNLTPDGSAMMNWFHPPNLLGPATEREAVWGPQMEKLLTEAGLKTLQVSHGEMKKAAFFKTVLNAALNALCSAHGLTMNQAMRLRHTREMARGILREGLRVASLVGYVYGEDALDRCMEYLDAGGDHYPSMWFDLKYRRPTEIEYINGKIVKVGRMFKDVDVDLNLFFTSAIVTQEIRNKTRSEDDIPDYLYS